MSRSDLRRGHLSSICGALTAYLDQGHAARLTTVVDDESVAELVNELSGKSAVIFTIEDWDAFCALLEAPQPAGNVG